MSETMLETEFLKQQLSFKKKLNLRSHTCSDCTKVADISLVLQWPANIIVGEIRHWNTPHEFGPNNFGARGD